MFSSESPAFPSLERWPAARRRPPRGARCRLVRQHVRRLHRPFRYGVNAGQQRLPVYQDGTYSADGTYASPNGTETVGVELTLAAGTVTAVNITQHPSNPNTGKFQGEFAGGIAAQVVGKSIDELNVSKVAGSSLTSGGFNQALDKIKAEAQ